jgi:site-specific DNA-methyltransferase (adenine-specific)
VTARPRARKPTSTSAFGAGSRESHDASAFYARFEVPEFSTDTEIRQCTVKDRLFCGDSRKMSELDDKCVALVVTSPPYYAGKAYEEALGEGHIPGSYLEFLEMLRDVFAECTRVLEPGGRICVNVANLGRKPYRSLSADVISILQDDLHLLLRGEIVWQKAKGASGNCAWGSFQSASNPTLRDVTERVVVASKGRLDRALSRTCRTRTRSAARSSWRRRSTCGRSAPNERAGSTTRRRSPWSSPSDSCTSTRTWVTWCSTRSSVRARPQ